MGEIAPKGFILIPNFDAGTCIQNPRCCLSLIICCIVGVVIAGFDPATGLSKLFQASSQW